MNKDATFQQHRSTYDWSSIPENAAVKVWVNDLCRLHNAPHYLDDWSLAGQGVVFEGDDESDVLDLLTNVARETGFELVVIDALKVIEDFPQWFDDVQSHKPTLIYLSESAWQGSLYAEKHTQTPSYAYDPDKCRHFRQDLKDLMHERLTSQQTILVTSTTQGSHLDITLRSVGLFDRRIEVPKVSDDGLFKVFVEAVGRDKCDNSILGSQRKVASLLRHDYPDTRRRLLMQKAMQRLAWREGRQLTFEDLVCVLLVMELEMRIQYFKMKNS